MTSDHYHLGNLVSMNILCNLGILLDWVGNLQRLAWIFDPRVHFVFLLFDIVVDYYSYLLLPTEWRGWKSQKGRPSKRRGNKGEGKQWANTAVLSEQSTWGEIELWLVTCVILVMTGYMCNTSYDWLHV